jgi:hypothetical protein
MLEERRDTTRSSDTIAILRRPGDTRADTFKMNTRGQLLAIAEPRVIGRTKQSRKASVQGCRIYSPSTKGGVKTCDRISKQTKGKCAAS